jgi:zinc protease
MKAGLISVMIAAMFFTAISQNILRNPGEVPVDPDVRIGRLENGLVYYIRKNARPENRVELRLAVNVGSIVETEQESGLAHFTEHMCFNGTTNFPKNELVSVIEKMGMRFGADLNAYTGFDETVYMLQVPTDNPELIDQGFQILEDWAHQVTFAGEEIDKERGVILEEYRLGTGADDRMRKKAFPVIFAGSKYADRLPIGKKEVLETFKHDVIRNFYKKWYRPNLQAIVVVGNINPDEMEAKIKKHFSGIVNPANAPKREVYSIPDNKDPLISIETDPEAQGNTIMFFYKHPKKDVVTLNDFRDNLKAEVFSEMFNERLFELGMKPDAPFIQCGSYYGDFLARSLDAFLGYVVSKENMMTESFDLMFTELERLKRHGFTAGELERAKKNVLKKYDKMSKEHDKIESARLAQRYVAHFLSGDPIPSVNQSYELVKTMLPDMQIEEISLLASKWITKENLVIMVTAPQKPDLKVPAREEFLAVIENVKKKEIEAYQDSDTQRPLIVAELTAGKITSEKQMPEIDATSIVLSNGATVIFKKTDFKNNEVLFSAYSMGGHSLYPDEDFFSANYAPAVIDESGIGGFSKIELNKNLAGKSIEITTYISEIKEGMTGKTTPEDLESAMELIHLYFTEPRKDVEAYKAFVSKTKNQLKFFSNSPMYAFYKEFFELVTQKNARSVVIPTPEQIDKIDLERAMKIYAERFADASDFTFVFVGNFEEAELKMMAEKYIGSLPAKNSKETYKDISAKFPEKTVKQVFKKGIEEQGMIGLAMEAPFNWNEENKINMYALNQVLNIRLRENIREDQGGAYSIGAQMVPEKYPVGNVKTIIIFGCDPKKQDKYVKIILAEMNKLMKEGPTADEISKVKETMMRERETNLKKNDWWKSKIENMSYYNETPSNITQFNDLVNGISPEKVKEAAGMYLTPGRYVQLYLQPEAKPKKK